VNEGSKILQCTEDLFNLDDDKKNFNIAYWINPDRGELFFAEKIILVEGPTDKTIIPYLSKKNRPPCRGRHTTCITQFLAI